MVGSGPAQQAMLSEGSDPANPPKQIFELNLYKINLHTDGGTAGRDAGWARGEPEASLQFTAQTGQDGGQRHLTAK